MCGRRCGCELSAPSWLDCSSLSCHQQSTQVHTHTHTHTHTTVQYVSVINFFTTNHGCTCIPLSFVCVCVCVLLFRVIEFLLKRGAHVNAEDEFSSAQRMASRLRISPGRGWNLSAPPLLLPTHINTHTCA